MFTSLQISLRSRLALKFCIIVIALLFRSTTFQERASAVQGLGEGMYLLLVFLIFTALIFVSAIVRNMTLRWSYAVVLAAASLPVLGYEHSSGVPMGYFDFVTMIDASSAFDDAFQMFAGSFIWAFLSANLILFGVGMAPEPRHAVGRWFIAALPSIGAIAVIALVFARSGSGMAPIPASWAGIGYTAYYVSDRLSGSRGPRKSVVIAQTIKPDERDIVLIVDESVAGHYLDINEQQGVRSGLQGLAHGPHIYNFGLAASISNCSMTTNVNLRFGGTMENYADHIATFPSIWSYAKKAGYQTVYLYGQRGGQYENYMTDSERKDIDARLYFDGIPTIDRDWHIAKLIADYANNDKREFILVNKFGSHFPVNDAYPPAFAHFQPALPSKANFAEGDDSLANRANIISRPNDWSRYRNSYRNTITWTVGHFFDTLLANTRLEKSIIIYTSDHGQTFHERGNPGLATHCYSDPQVEEFVVPLVVMEGQRTSRIDWSDAVKRNFNLSSHFRIFPTILDLMGYDPAMVNQYYGAALDAKLRDPMQSASNMYLYAPKQTKWHKVDISSVILPPLTDRQHAERANNWSQKPEK